MESQDKKVPREKENRSFWHPGGGFDILIFVIFVLVSLFFFLYEDLLIAARDASKFLDGHFLDFYDSVGKTATYFPSIFVVIALWMAPLRLFNIIGHIETIADFSFIARLWLELFPVLISALSAVVLYKICLKLKMGTNKARLSVCLFLSTPILFFGVEIFSQHDIYTVLFVLLGIYYWLQDRDYLFALMFGISVTFKYFSLPVFLVALVLKEKSIPKLLKYLLIFIAPIALEFLIFCRSDGFLTYVFGFWGGNFPFIAALFTREIGISIFVVGMAAVCAAAWFTRPADRKERYEYLIYYSSFVCFFFFGVSMWHPQYLVFAVPFWVMGTVNNKRSYFFILLDFVMMYFFVVYTVDHYRGMVDEHLLMLGVLENLIEAHPLGAFKMKSLMMFTSRSVNYSILSACILVNAIYKHPKYWLEDYYVDNLSPYWGLARLRFIGGVLCFILPAFLSLWLVLH